MIVYTCYDIVPVNNDAYTSRTGQKIFSSKLDRLVYESKLIDFYSEFIIYRIEVKYDDNKISDTEIVNIYNPSVK